MILADTVDTANALSSLGVPGLVAVILVLAGVVIVLFKMLVASYAANKSIQDGRLQDMREITDKYGKSFEQHAILIQQIHDSIFNPSRRR